LATLHLDGGVRIRTLRQGKWKTAGLREGFIITHIDKVTVDNVADINRILELKQGGILIEGVSKENEKGTYGVSW